MSCLCHVFASVHCCIVVTWRQRADLLALVCDVYCDFVTFPFGILGQVWYLIVSIPGPCCLSYFNLSHCTINPVSAMSEQFWIICAKHSGSLLVSEFLAIGFLVS